MGPPRLPAGTYTIWNAETHLAVSFPEAGDDPAGVALHCEQFSPGNPQVWNLDVTRSKTYFIYSPEFARLYVAPPSEDMTRVILHTMRIAWRIESDGAQLWKICHPSRDIAWECTGFGHEVKISLKQADGSRRQQWTISVNGPPALNRSVSAPPQPHITLAPPDLPPVISRAATPTPSFYPQTTSAWRHTESFMLFIPRLFSSSTPFWFFSSYDRTGIHNLSPSQQGILSPQDFAAALLSYESGAIIPRSTLQGQAVARLDDEQLQKACRAIDRTRSRAQAMQVAADGALEAREEAERVNRDKAQELSEFEAALKQLEATHAEELALARATIQEKDDELAKSLEANHLTTSERNALRTSYDQKDADNAKSQQEVQDLEANVQSLRSQLAGSRDDVERLESALTESRKQQALLGEKSKQMASYEEKLASLRAEVQNTSKEKKKQAEQIRKLERSGREYLTWSQAKGEEIQCLKDDKKRLEKLLADALARAELAESIPPAPTESEDLGRKIRELELAYEQAEATNRAVTAREAAQVEELRALKERLERRQEANLPRQYLSPQGSQPERMSVDVRGAVISLEALNADIEAVCEDIVDLIDSKYDLSEKSTVHFRANFAPYLAPATLFLSPYGAHRQLDLFLTIFVRYRMCTALLKIMKPFHPAFGVRVKNKKAAVCPDLAKYIESCYDDMKASGVQSATTRWRLWASAYLEDRVLPPFDEQVADWGAAFASRVVGEVVGLFRHGLGEEMGDCFDEKTRDALSKIGADAYRWRQSIQTSPIDQEFQATMFGSEGTYSDDDMRLDTGQTDGLEVNPKLVACVGLGLRSVTVTGPHQPPQATRYMKAVVVTEKYF